MGAGIAASPHCAESWIGRCSLRGRALGPSQFTILAYQLRRRVRFKRRFLLGSPFPNSSGLLPCGNRPVELLLPSLASTLPCGSASRGHLALRRADFVRAVLPSCRPDLTRCRTRPILPELRTGPGILRPPDHRSSFRGPSWDDRSSHLPGHVRGPTDRAKRRRSSLPAPLADSALRRSFAGPTTSWGSLRAHEFHSGAFAGGDRLLNPFQFFPSPCGSGPFRRRPLPPITHSR